MSAKKDISKLIKKAEEMGLRVERSGKHYKVYPKSRIQSIIIVSKTPSDPKALDNIKKDLKRAGVV